MTYTNHPYHFALTGYPLGHSLSPRIHNAALEACGLAGDYILRPVPPEEAPAGLKVLFAELREKSLDGLNVTIPHKQAVLGLCEELSPAAQAIGAANLFYRREGRILGDNSDAPGFLAGLTHVQVDWKSSPRDAVILGAGGSARAVVYALVSSGWRVTLLARRLEQAQDLADSFSDFLPAELIQTATLNEKMFESLRADLVVNTTPVGMYPDVCCSPWPAQIPLPAGAVVYDLVYNPRNTVLLDQASAQALPVIGGIHMLIEQAAISFECWTGINAPRQIMLDAVQASN